MFIVINNNMKIKRFQQNPHFTQNFQEKCFETNNLNKIILNGHYEQSALFLIGYYKHKKMKKGFIKIKLNKLFKYRMKREPSNNFAEEMLNKYYNRTWFKSTFHNKKLNIIF